MFITFNLAHRKPINTRHGGGSIKPVTISDPLIQTIGLMNENGLFGATGNCFSNVWEDGEWATGFQQNTSDAYYRVSVVGRGTISKVKFFINSFNDIDAGISATGNFGAIRIGLFSLDGTCKGQTAWLS